MDFHINSGLAALKDVGNEAEDLHFYGGDYGIVTIKPSPGWQFTLLDSTFEGQRKAAISEHEAGLTLDHDTFRNRPRSHRHRSALLRRAVGEKLTLREHHRPRRHHQQRKQSRAPRSISKTSPATTCRSSPCCARAARRPPAPADDYVVKSYSHGLTIPAPGLAGEIRTAFDAHPVHALPAEGSNIIARPSAHRHLDQPPLARRKR